MPIRPLLTENMEAIEQLYERGEHLTGLASGFPELDEKTLGFQPSNLIIIAARPSMGKSALMGDFALNAAVKQKSPVVIFSLEMSRNEIVQRFLSSEAKVDSQRIRKGSLQEQDWARLSNALGRLHEAPIFIDDSASITLMEMRAKCRRLKAKYGLGLVIIDYLQLMQSPRRSENRNQEVSEISRSLKILARELEVPVVCASQLNRAVEQRADKRPLLGDLRESGCLSGESLVTLASGQQVPIAALVGQTPRVVCLDGWNLSIRRASRVWKTGHRQVYRLRLGSGRVIRATSNHKFRLLDDWQPLENLRPGDRIAAPRRSLRPADPVRWPSSRIELLAHLIGDGCYASRQPLHYTSASKTNLDVVRRAAREAFGIVVRDVVPGSYAHLYLSAGGNRWSGNPLIEWLRELGIYGHRSHEKHIPGEVFSFDDDDVAMFLRHLWATDGCVWMGQTPDRGPRSRIYYSSNSERLARQVQSLLLRYGITGALKATSKAGYRAQYHVDVRGAVDQLLFASSIGGIGQREVTLAEMTPWLQQIRPNTNKDTIPQDVWERVKAGMKAAGITQRRMAALRGSTYGGTSHFRFAPSRSLVNDYASILDDSNLRDLASSDVYWDEVASIEPDGTEDVYDMTVPGKHNFIANDIVVHNSIEQDADLVMFLYRDEFYNQDSEAKGEAELIVAKHRNGPTGTVHLAFMNQYTKFASIARGPQG
jgi:replicative DNA helicase